jgi:hypothetical protein
MSARITRFSFSLSRLQSHRRERVSQRPVVLSICNLLGPRARGMTATGRNGKQTRIRAAGVEGGETRT